MKRTALFISVVCLFTSALADLRSELESVNSKIVAAMKKRDADAFGKIVKAGVTKDFKYVENGQTQTLDQMIEGMRMGFAMMTKVTKCEAKIKTLKETGNSGTATIWHSMAGDMKMEDGKTHKMTFEGTSTNTFRKEGGKWKMSSMVWGKQTMKMDGKPFDPTKMGGGR